MKGSLVEPRCFNAAMSFLSWAMIFFRSDLDIDFHCSFKIGSKACRFGLRRSASEAQFVGRVCSGMATVLQLPEEAVRGKESRVESREQMDERSTVGYDA